VFPYGPLWRASGSPLLKFLWRDWSHNWIVSRTVCHWSYRDAQFQHWLENWSEIFHGFFLQANARFGHEYFLNNSFQFSNQCTVWHYMVWCWQGHNINVCREILRSMLKGQQCEEHIEGLIQESFHGLSIVQKQNRHEAWKCIYTMLLAIKNTINWPFWPLMINAQHDIYIYNMHICTNTNSRSHTCTEMYERARLCGLTFTIWSITCVPIFQLLQFHPLSDSWSYIWFIGASNFPLHKTQFDFSLCNNSCNLHARNQVSDGLPPTKHHWSFGNLTSKYLTFIGMVAIFL
jgi:hypothetical protein